jgi:hypothetical protein
VLQKIREAVTLKAATAVPTSYGTWASGDFHCTGLAEVELLLDIVKSDATSLQLKVDVDQQDGSAYYPRWAPTSGVAALDEVSITLAGLSATDKLALRVDVRSAAKIRVGAKTTGGGGTLTLACKAIGGGP